ncbi:hypothetical protein BB2000_0244 [Proteus mirabilis BB2000]|nr:hypothetical protein BB2000_0244 [Proteus mirabilis BB2000]
MLYFVNLDKITTLSLKESISNNSVNLLVIIL